MTRSSIDRRVERRRLPHWLALCAMLVQLVASFGHIHPEQFRFLERGHGTPALTAGDGPTQAPLPSTLADVDCPICASVQLLASSALPDPVRLSPPGVASLVPVPASEELRLAPPPHFLFTTRAPPSV